MNTRKFALMVGSALLLGSMPLTAATALADDKDAFRYSGFRDRPPGS